MVFLRAQLCYSQSKTTPTTEKIISVYLPPVVIYSPHSVVINVEPT